MINYGIPYMGSKSKIVPLICRIFPRAKNFYDLFGGGFSVIHYMVLNRFKDFKNFHYNELRPGASECIQKAIRGEFSYQKYKPKFITREEFLQNKDDFLTATLWSFGNNLKTYLFSKEIEFYKKSMHNAIVFNKFDKLAKQVFQFNEFDNSTSIKQRRIFLRSKIESYRLNGIPHYLKSFLNQKQLEQLERLQQLEQLQQLQSLQQLERLQQLQQLEQLERLERLQQLQQLQQLTFQNKSYDKVEIKDDSIIYCDPPYRDTAGYIGEFDNDKFENWAANSKHPVFISEYSIKHEKLIPIFKTKKRSLLAVKNSEKSNNIIKEEKVYANQAAIKSLLRSRRA